TFALKMKTLIAAWFLSGAIVYSGDSPYHLGTPKFSDNGVVIYSDLTNHSDKPVYAVFPDSISLQRILDGEWVTIPFPPLSRDFGEGNWIEIKPNETKGLAVAARDYLPLKFDQYRIIVRLVTGRAKPLATVASPGVDLKSEANKAASSSPSP
ncbi:MAG: hypothetical protein MI807_17920, partial [Verrucomicrobiales bacterium]|nr:hypothetical protein [Verrucomicrobiales bacterium]